MGAQQRSPSLACLCQNLDEFKRTEEAAARYSVGGWDEMRALSDLLWNPIHLSVGFILSAYSEPVSHKDERERAGGAHANE